MARGARASSGEDIPDDLAVDGARDAVLELEVHLGDRVLGEDGGVRDVTCVGILSVHRFSIQSILRSRFLLLCFGRMCSRIFGFDVRIAADSTMLRMVNLLMALSLGVHREQLEQRTGLTWPLPFLLRPLRSRC
jgi:hypothetical protein